VSVILMALVMLALLIYAQSQGQRGAR